jgi:hypothetical protein
MLPALCDAEEVTGDNTEASHGFYSLTRHWRLKYRLHYLNATMTGTLHQIVIRFDQSWGTVAIIRITLN